MIRFNMKALKPNASYQKNTLCKIADNRTIQVCETHKDSDNVEVVNLEYFLKEKQYALFGNEYRNPHLSEHECKTTDVLTCIIDDENETIYSLIFDIKHNISAFSDNLFNENAMLVAINEVTDFVEQLCFANMHKNNFLTYHKAAGYVENIEFGIVTKSFEPEKFIEVANFLENLNDFQKPISVQSLVWYKLKNNLMPYVNEANKIRNFANKKVEIDGTLYELSVYILQKVTECEYVICIRVENRMGEDEL